MSASSNQQKSPRKREKFAKFCGFFAFSGASSVSKNRQLSVKSMNKQSSIFKLSQKVTIFDSTSP